MRIIAQKSNTMNTSNFIQNSLESDYIDAMNFNVTYTKDNKIVVFSIDAASTAVTNTINTSTYEELQGYEVLLLDKLLSDLSKEEIKKDIYLNLSPVNLGVLSEENIKEVSNFTNFYIDSLKEILEKYKDFIIHIHSTSRSIVTKLKEKLKKFPIGFAFIGNDLNFIDTNYYVLTSDTQNDTIIALLLKENKDVIIYVTSDYYISYLYEHYLGEKSTPYLQQTFQKLGIMTNYPTVIYKIFQI